MATAPRKCKKYIFGCKTIRKKYHKLSGRKIFQVSNKCFFQTSITCHRFFVSSKISIPERNQQIAIFLLCFLELLPVSLQGKPMYGKGNTKCHCFPFLPSQFMDLWHFQKTVDTHSLPQFPTQLLFTVNLSTKRQEGFGSRLSGHTNPKKEKLLSSPFFPYFPHQEIRKRVLF